MSVLTKITGLFLISLTLMIGIGYRIDTINTQNYESIVVQKYVADGQKIFGWIATSSAAEMEGRLKTLNLMKCDPETPTRIIMSQPHTFGLFEIFEADGGDYVMHIRYIDDELFLRDTTLESARQERWILNALVIADVAVLAVIFFIILRMLSPLRMIALSMRRFAGGDYEARSDIRTRDEIGEVAHTYNEMAQIIQNLILSRQELLRDVGHELRTPIARALFALEQIEDSAAKESLLRSMQELDRLTRELLEIERLRSAETLRHESFSAETLVLEALSKLHLTEESSVEVIMESNFILNGDLAYLSLALKNLMENGLKYAEILPVKVYVSAGSVCILNHGKALEKEVSQLVGPFVRDEASRSTPGFGLGLNIVTRIVEKHGFTLTHQYEEGIHRFCIHTAPPS